MNKKVFSSAVANFLEKNNLNKLSITLLKNDASKRRYYRFNNYKNKSIISLSFSFRFMEFQGNVKITTTEGELLITDQLYYDTENEWLFTEDDFEYTDKTNKIIANRLDSNRDFTDLVTGSWNRKNFH